MELTNKLRKHLLVLGIIELFLFVLAFIMLILQLQSVVLWAEGILKISSFMMMVLLLYFVGILIIMHLYKAQHKKGFLVLLSVAIIGFVGLTYIVSQNTTQRYYYQEGVHHILIIDRKRFITGRTEFYYKANFLFAEEFASCENDYGNSCDYEIIDNKLVLTSYAGGEMIVETFDIPDE
jgi:hypothetical protein